MLPEAFIRRLEEELGPDRARTVLDALSGAPSVSVRLNPAKLTECPFPDSERVPWSPYGYILKERPNFTLDPLFHAGCYYVQDSSAMFVGTLFRAALERFGPGVTVLDLCAAPGGKIKSGLDKVVDGLVDVSNGKMPEGFDPSQFKL